MEVPRRDSRPKSSWPVYLILTTRSILVSIFDKKSGSKSNEVAKFWMSWSQCTQSCLKVVSKLSQSCRNVFQKLSQNLFQSCPKVVSSSFKVALQICPSYDFLEFGVVFLLHFYYLAKLAVACCLNLPSIR